MDDTMQGAAGQAGADGASPGASGSNGLPGQDAVAAASSATDTTDNATATGGMGGNGGVGAYAPSGSDQGGQGGDGSYGGNATATAATTAATTNYTSAGATANGGTGGSGAQGGYPTGRSGVGGNGGNAEGTTAVDDNADGYASAIAAAAGGLGGASSYDIGFTDTYTGDYSGNLYAGGNGGVAENTTASAIGLTGAAADARQYGGAGGGGPQGGVGADSSLTDAVSGSTTDGTLSLEQTSQGGAGGSGYESTGGKAGAAASNLTFDDTASPTQSAMLQIAVNAVGGAGGSGVTGADDGADASESSTITGAHDLQVTDLGEGGDGGASGAFIVGDAGGNGAAGGNGTASGSAVTTSATGNVTIDVTADGGSGGAADDGSYGDSPPANGGDGGQGIIGAVSGTGGASADVEADAGGGNGGTSDGAIGGTGANATLTNAVTGSTQGGTLTLVQDASAGAGGNSFGGTGGQGGSASSDLNFDDTANANQSANFYVTVQAEGANGGLDEMGANPGLNQMGSSYEVSGTGGSAVASSNINAADTLPSSTPTNISLGVFASGGEGLDGGDATATGTASGGIVNVQSYATAGSGMAQTDFALDKAGTATATATGTDAGGTVFAQASTGLSNPYGNNDTSSITATAYTSVFDTTTAGAVAGYNQVGSFDTSSQAVADEIGLPTTAMGGTDVGPGETLLFDAEQGASGAAGATGSQTTTSTIDTEIDLTQFNTASEFLVDLHKASLIGDGVTGVTFNLSEDGKSVIHEAFTSGASAEAYFTDHVIDLGSFNTLTDDSTSMDLTMTLTVTTDSAGSGFYAEAEGAGVACYCPGTLIRTDRGDVAIEDLEIGDKVATLHGPAQPIKWIGRRSYDGRFVAGQVLMLPVCVKRNAIEQGVPARDLWVSPGHALYLDGVLVPAWLLVNGTTIIQADAVRSITYIHIEFEAHEVIFAEDCAAESFVDDRCRGQFENAAEYYALYPNETADAPPLCAMRVENGFMLQAIQRRLAARARLHPAQPSNGPLRGFVDQAGPMVISGWAQDETQPEEPVCLDIMVGGKRMRRVLANHYRADLRQAGLGSGKHGFELRLPEGNDGPVEVRRSADQRVLSPTGAATSRDATQAQRRVA